MMENIPITSDADDCCMDVDVFDEIEDSNQTLAISAMEMAFHIDLVLHNIASNLNLRDLKNFRLINKSANEAARSIMVRDVKNVVKLKYNRKLKTFLSNRRQNVGVLVEVVKKSEVFPCSSFSFVVGNLGLKKLQPLFNILQTKTKVKTLSLIGDGSHKAHTNQKDLIDLLQTKLPDVETLHFGLFNYEWKVVDESGVALDRRVTLPALKVLYCINDYDAETINVNGLEMLASAPNLQEVHGFHDKYLDLVGSVITSIDQIKSYTYRSWFYFYEEEIWPNLLRFANTQPKLESFDLHFYYPTWDDVAEYAALMKILKSSQNTLKHLRCNDDVRQFELPEFSSVSYLTIDVINSFYKDFHFIKRPPGEILNFRPTCFPELKTVTVVFDVDLDTDYYELRYFFDIFPAVKTLNIIHLFAKTPYFFEEFGTIFPNITSLKIECKAYTNELHWITDSLFSLVEIEIIGLHSELEKKCNCRVDCPWIYYDDEVDEEIDPELDTEIDEGWSCRCIKLFIEGIIKAKCLKKIKFLYDCSLPSATNHLLEAIKEHVLEILPELQVTIAYNHFADHKSEFTGWVIHHPRIAVVHQVYEKTPAVWNYRI